MCTVILGYRVHPQVPLIVAANRDEFYERPSAPPGRLDGVSPRFGPRDLRGGGTWIAVNRRGVVAVLTNAAPPDQEPVPGLRSRGEVVGLALDAATAREGAQRAAAIPPDRIRPFYLLIAGAGGAHAVAPGDGGFRVTTLLPGVHVQENRPLDDPAAEKVARGLALAGDLAGWPEHELVPRLHAALSDHEDAVFPLRRLCVHTPIYGTRSLSIVLLGGGDPGWWYRDGHPCEGEPVRDAAFDVFRAG